MEFHILERKFLDKFEFGVHLLLRRYRLPQSHRLHRGHHPQ